MPVWNGARFISSALDSILTQEFADFELIISDNGSDDLTERICQEYAARDPRIHYHRESTNRGAAWNYNRVFGLSRGKYFKWAAHDDELMPYFLAKCVDALEQGGEEVVLVYPKAIFIDPSGSLIGEDRDCLHLTHSFAPYRLAGALARVNMMSAIFGLFRRSALARTRLIDRFIASDYVLMAEISILGKVKEVPELLFRRRQEWGSCMEANRTNDDIRAWFDPTLRGKRSLAGARPPGLTVQFRLILEWWRSLNRLQLRAGERLLCYLIVPTVWFARKIRNWAGRRKASVKRWMAPAPTPQE